MLSFALVGRNLVIVPSELPFLAKNRCAEIARLHPLDDAELQHFHDLLNRRAELQRRPDVTACTGRVHVRVRGIKGDAEELELLGEMTPLL